MFFIIVAIPFFLIFKTENTKKSKVIFVESRGNIQARDTIKLYELIEGKEEEYFMDFKIGKDERVYFYKDTVGIKLVTGFFGGYSLIIELIGDEYNSKLINYDCTWREELKIKEQILELENFKLGHNEILKGNFFCEANHENRFTDRVEKIRISGYFEFVLKDEVEEAKLWQ